MARLSAREQRFKEQLESGEIPHPNPNDPSLFPQCYTNGYLMISHEAWARGVRLDDLHEGMPAAIYWNGTYERDVPPIGTPATVEVIRRAKRSGRILEVIARREDKVPLVYTHVDPNFIETIYDGEMWEPAAPIAFTSRTYGTLLRKGTSGRSVMRLIIGTMWVAKEEPVVPLPDMPF